MHIVDRIAVILLAVLSSATASSGANYIRPEATLPLRLKVADTAEDKKTLAEKKTLALLLLMLRDGRGAR